jgi:cellulose synthase/poly-beta-1,6-N-acetylglucosamine synthase-like glycosyltransferase
MKVLHPVSQKGISLLVPCYNEAPILKFTIEGILNIEYDDLEVIFINDGSKDDTFQVMYELLDLHIWEAANFISASAKVKTIYKSNKYPFMYVIDKHNSGKADSLNIGISYAQKELIVTMDGDCVLEKDALLIMNKVFDDDDVIAAGGIVHIMQMFKLQNRFSLTVIMQVLDYIKGFYFYKASLAYNDALTIISGAFGVFKKNSIIEVGGFKTGLGEDIDITLRLQEYAKENNKKVVFNKSAVCYTECPESIQELVRQRVRWQKGFIDAILSNSSYLFRNVFRNNLCFFIIIDALMSNSFATVVFLINLVLIFTKLVYGYALYIFICYLNTIIFNIICSVVAIRLAKKSMPDLKTKLLYFMIIFDMTFFQFLRIFFFLIGTVTFYFDNKHWYKVNRTCNIYKI